MAKGEANKRSVGVFLHVIRHDGKDFGRLAVHSHEEAWSTAMLIHSDPEVLSVEARVGR